MTHKTKLMIFYTLGALIILLLIFGAGGYILNIQGGPTPKIPDDLQAHIESKSDLIVVTRPQPLSIIESPFVISGEARGTWFFEATFPVVLVDWDGRIIGEGFATAQGEWMTEDFVRFRSVLEFRKPENIGDFSKRGTLILQKNNPSGLPQHDDALEIPVRFNFE